MSTETLQVPTDPEERAQWLAAETQKNARRMISTVRGLAGKAVAVELPTDPIARQAKLRELSAFAEQAVEVEALDTEKLVAEAKLFLAEQDAEKRAADAAQRQSYEDAMKARAEFGEMVEKADAVVREAEEAKRRAESAREARTTRKVIAFYAEIKAHPDDWRDRHSGRMDLERIEREEARIRGGGEPALAFPHAFRAPLAG